MCPYITFDSLLYWTVMVETGRAPMYPRSCKMEQGNAMNSVRKLGYTGWIEYIHQHRNQHYNTWNILGTYTQAYTRACTHIHMYVSTHTSPPNTPHWLSSLCSNPASAECMQIGRLSTATQMEQYQLSNDTEKSRDSTTLLRGRHRDRLRGEDGKLTQTNSSTQQYYAPSCTHVQCYSACVQTDSTHCSVPLMYRKFYIYGCSIR